MIFRLLLDHGQFEFKGDYFVLCDNRSHQFSLGTGPLLTVRTPGVWLLPLSFGGVYECDQVSCLSLWGTLYLHFAQSDLGTITGAVVDPGRR